MIIILQVPRNGLEYVDDPYMYGDENYHYPKLAHLSRTPRGTIEVHEVFLRGDKMKLFLQSTRHTRSPTIHIARNSLHPHWQIISPCWYRCIVIIIDVTYWKRQPDHPP